MQLKRAFPLFLLFAAPLLHSQTTPACSFPVFTFTATGALASQLNNGPTRSCVAWRVTYTTTGFTDATVQFETSPDNSNWTAVPNSICSASVQPPCVNEGANPMAPGMTGTVAIRAFDKYVRLNVTGVTGTGSGFIVLLGYIGTTASASIGGGGSGPSGGPGALIAGFSTTDAIGSGNTYWGLSGGLNTSTSPPNADDGNYAPLCIAGTLGKLAVNLSFGPQGMDGGLTATVMKNGVDTVVQVSIPAGSATGVYTDLTHTVAWTACDQFCLHVLNASASSTTLANFSFSII